MKPDAPQPKRVVRTDPRARFRDSARVALWGVGLYGLVQGIGAYMAQNHTGAVIAQVVVAELGTGWLGVTWSDPLAPMPSASAMAHRALRGAAYGAAAAAVLIGVSAMLRMAKVGPGAFALSPLVMGLLMSAFGAARDELLLRGLPLRVLGPHTSVWARIAVCGAAAGAFRFGVGPAGVSWTAIAFATLSGCALGALWIRDRGIWLAWGANATFGFVTGTLAQGALLDVTGPAAIDSTLVAVVCALAFAASGVALIRSVDDPRGKPLQ